MKWKILILGLLLILCLNLVAAGNSIDLDFVNNVEPVYMYEGDEVRFDMVGGTHSIIVETVTMTAAKFDIVPFIGTNITVVRAGQASLDTIMKIDLDKDGSADINVGINSIDNDGRVLVLFQKTKVEQDAPITAGVVIEEEEEDEKLWDKFDKKDYGLAVLALIAVVVVGFFLFREDENTMKKSDIDVKEEIKEEETKETSEEDKVEETEEEEPVEKEE